MSSTVADAEISRRVEVDLAAGFRNFPWGLEASFALGARLLAQEGHSRALLGQFTARDGQGQYITVPFGHGLDEADEATLVHFDDELRPQNGAPMVNPGVRFHVWIYRCRPDVQAIVHTHPPAAVALSMTHERLRVNSMDAAMLYDSVGYLDHWPGTPEGDAEGELISEALGKHGALLLCNHGLLTVGSSIQEAVYRAVFFEWAAAAQLQARAVGDLKAVEEASARSAHHAMTRQAYINATVAYLYRKAQRRATA